MIMFLFFLWARNLSYDTMIYEVSESRPEVGSSKKMTAGSEIS